MVAEMKEQFWKQCQWSHVGRSNQEQCQGIATSHKQETSRTFVVPCLSLSDLGLDLLQNWLEVVNGILSGGQ